ncbi:hypothetical protein BDZ45DRAFT_649031 [Acephala macrosclerotiorum]|nr:hypothetical protein BDZ45DRAFT_649031 [Acephala macrosclerotiorum]
MECPTDVIPELPQLAPSSINKQAKSPTKILSAKASDLELLPAAPSSECLTFIKRNTRYTLAKQSKLKNSLLAGVGFLELANAGDFAANVWNQVPVPPYAIALMIIGGTLALGISYFAFKDARLSWRNFLYLRDERRYLRTQKTYYGQDRQIIHSLDSQLNVNFREMGTELVDRIGMDIMMGFGAVAVGVGTFMAIDGANHSVWQASNLLSGYIGNVPCALYGVINIVWSAYVWRRARRHGITGAKELEADTVKRMLKNRVDSVKLHAAVNGIAGAVAGAASIVTATLWWGYVVLAPCIVSSILINYLWRHRIGYDRPFVRRVLRVDGHSLVAELKFVASAQRVLEEESLSRIVSDPKSITSIMELIIKNQLFEDFCIRLLKDPELSVALFGPFNEIVTIDSKSLLIADDLSVCRLLEIAQACFSEMGPTCFKYQERYLLETLGCYLCISEVGTTLGKSSDSAV